MASPIAPAALEDSVAQFLSYRGYLDRRIGFENDRLMIEPGVQTRLIYLIISSTQIDSLRIGQALTRNRIALEAALVIEKIAREGNYYARLNLDSIVRTGYEAALYMTLVPGPVVKIARVQVDGLIHSDQKLVQTLLSRSVDRLLTDQALRQAERGASRISWLNFKPPVEVSPSPGYQSADLKFNFSEKKRFTFFGGFGYQSKDDFGLVWQLAAKLQSLFGRGRTFRIESERRELGHQTLSLRYRQPTFWPMMGAFGFELSTRDYQAQFSEFELQTFFDFRINYETIWGTSLGFKRVEPAGLLTGHSRYSVGLKLARSTINEAFSPSAGYRLSTELGYSHRRYSDDSLAVVPAQQVYNETRVAVTVEQFISLGRKLVVKTSFGYRGLETTEALVPLSEAILIGGPGSLRGYQNDRFAARRAGLITLEPRVRFGRGYLFVFYDGAWLGLDRLNNDSYLVVGEYRHGFGLGLALRGSSNRAALSFGWQPELAVDQPRLNIELSADL